MSERLQLQSFVPEGQQSQPVKIQEDLNGVVARIAQILPAEKVSGMEFLL